MDNESTLSLPDIEDRIAILRDNIRQLTEQAAAVSGAGSEELLAGRIAAQDAELQTLIAQRDAIQARRAQALKPAAPVKKAAPKTKKKMVKTAATKKAAPKRSAKKKSAKKAASKKKTAKKPVNTRKSAKKAKAAKKKKRK